MRFFERLLNGAVFLLFTLMILLVSIQVLNRYGTGLSIPWTEEATRTAYVLMIFIGSVLAVLQNNHVRVLSAVTRLPRQWRRSLAVLTALGSALFCGFVAYGMAVYALVNLESRFTTMSWLSIGWVMALVAAAMILAAGLFLRQALRGEDFPEIGK